MFRRPAIAILLGLALAAPPCGASLAEDRAATLAAIRSELAALADQLQALRAELVNGGRAAMDKAGGASALERMDAMEAALTRLTAQTEALQGRINAIVADGTNRIGDLEFRLCELEKGCDPSNLPITAALGGGSTAPAVTAPAPDPQAGTVKQPELAVAEQADFDRAKAALDGGDFRAAADGFAAFAQTYTGGPLTGEALFLRGEALTQLGETSQAARAYLDAFSGQPEGPRAPVALLRLGTSLAALGQNQEACATLGQVGVRYPAAPEAAEARTAMQTLGCQ
ncbi:MAG: tol-pal system protein YbgF [Rhodobacteraceae bacterium]|nr:tol-pal system protein YbgF [Paracoccaceae bacterium]